MNPAGIGIDMVEIERVETALAREGTAFLQRMFLSGEQEYCAGMPHPAAHYAARWAAKEAVAKALGTPIGPQLGCLDIEVRRKFSGEPFVQLHGAGAELAKRRGISDIHISLTHTAQHAAAYVLLTTSALR